jgi:RNA polymerase sigma-70 factor (ECF subfamily)
MGASQGLAFGHTPLFDSQLLWGEPRSIRIVADLEYATVTEPRSDPRTRASDPALWLRQHGNYLFGFAMSRVSDVHLAEDLVQETLLAAIERRDSFDARSQLRTWLVAILKRKIADHRRRAGRGRAAAQISTDAGLEERVEEQFDARGNWSVPPARWEPGADDATARAELHRMLAECLKGLPPQAAQVLLLSERQGLPAASVGKILGLTPTNVGVILYRARTALRRCLEQRWFSGTKEGP